MVTLSSRMKKLRLKHELTQKQFGEIFGIVKSTVSLYESGKSTPDDETKKNIAKYFNVSLDYLMGISDIENPYKGNEKIRKLSKQYQSKNKIGDILKLLREKKGLTQDNLAELLNIRRQTYSVWERNISNPDINTIIFLADYYKVDTDYILGRTNIKNTYQIFNPFLEEIQNLSKESKKELKKYVQFLKFKDKINKNKN